MPSWSRHALLDPAPNWVLGTKDTITLWHGCTTADANNIFAHGIDLSRCRVDTDFGQGFYVTTIKRQAQHWAWLRYFDLPLSTRGGERPVTLKFTLQPLELGVLESMSFVSDAYENLGFWSLVQHCRLSPPAPMQHRHEHPSRPSRWYDLVYGPVSAFWYQRLAVHDGDQLSFHTDQAIKLLNDQIDVKRLHGDKSFIEDVVAV